MRPFVEAIILEKMRAKMNKKNLLKLADYFDKFKPTKGRRFSMLRFSDSDRRGIHNENCGSVGCAVGHGPYAGIPKKLGESWVGYSERVFETYDLDESWTYLFGANWHKFVRHRSPKATALRIRNFVKSGGKIPVNPLGIAPRKGKK